MFHVVFIVAGFEFLVLRWVNTRTGHEGDGWCWADWLGLLSCSPAQLARHLGCGPAVVRCFLITTCPHCIIVYGYWKCSRNSNVYNCYIHSIKSKSIARTPWWQLINRSKFLSAIGYDSLASHPTLSSLPLFMYDYSTFFVIMHFCVPKVTWSAP